MTTRYSIYHPEGFWMFDTDIRDDDSEFNKVRINVEGTPGFNPRFPRWVRWETSDKMTIEEVQS